jgi:hypothetical protein
MKLFTISDEIDEDGSVNIETCSMCFAKDKEQAYEFYRYECLKYRTRIKPIDELKINQVDKQILAKILRNAMQSVYKKES